MTTATATLTVTDRGPQHRVYVLDCPHATTTIDYLIPADRAIDEEVVLELLRDRHRQTCGCAWAIRGRVQA